MSMVYSSKRVTTEERYGTQYWKFDTEQAEVLRYDEEADEYEQHYLTGEYAIKRLVHLAKWDKPQLVALLDSGKILEYAEEFQEFCEDKVWEMHQALEKSNEAYHAAQDRGDFVTAAGLCANDMDTAKQTVIREYVLTAPPSDN